jgi:hypothetical protein
VITVRRWALNSTASDDNAAAECSSGTAVASRALSTTIGQYNYEPIWDVFSPFLAPKQSKYIANRHALD